MQEFVHIIIYRLLSDDWWYNYKFINIDADIVLFWNKQATQKQLIDCYEHNITEKQFDKMVKGDDRDGLIKKYWSFYI